MYFEKKATFETFVCVGAENTIFSHALAKVAKLHLHPFWFVGPSLHEIVFFVGGWVGGLVFFWWGGSSLVCFGFYWCFVCLSFVLRLIFRVSLSFSLARLSPWPAFFPGPPFSPLSLSLSTSFSLSLYLSLFLICFFFFSLSLSLSISFFSLSLSLSLFLYLAPLRLSLSLSLSLSMIYIYVYIYIFIFYLSLSLSLSLFLSFFFLPCFVSLFLPVFLCCCLVFLGGSFCLLLLHELNSFKILS